MKINQGFLKSVLAALVVLALLSTSFCCAKKNHESSADATEQTQSDTVEMNDSANTTNTDNPDNPADTNIKTAKNPYGKYEPGITLTTVFIDENRRYPEGQSWDNNIWTQAYEEQLGITFEYLWTASYNEFEAKMNMSIAANELPDVMVVSYDQFFRMAKAGLLEDLTELFEDYASDELKYGFHVRGGLAPIMNTIDGKLYGIGDGVEPQTSAVFAYRDDWLENLGLQAPKTVDDIIEFMYAASQGDPNQDGKKVYGLPLHKDIFDNMALGGFLNMYGVRPEAWVDVNGKLEYGAIQPEMKIVLEQLHQMFLDGVINPQFGIVDKWGRMKAEYMDNLYGCGFVPDWWTDWIGNTIAKNTDGKGTWSFMAIPSVDGGSAKVDFIPRQIRVACVLKGTSNPEALIKIQNLNLKLDNSEPDIYHTYVEDGTHISVFQLQLLRTTLLDAAYKSPDELIEVARAVEKKDPSGLRELKLLYYERCMKYLGGDLSEYGIYGVMGPGGSYEAFYEANQNNLFEISKYYGPNTSTMNQKMSGLNSKIIETVTKIIMEGNVAAEFDALLDFWNTQGGAEITQEVNEWYNNR